MLAKRNHSNTTNQLANPSQSGMCLVQWLFETPSPPPPFSPSSLSLRNFDSLIPDAPELIHSYLEGEQDASCKRNAFMMLIHVDRVG